LEDAEEPRRFPLPLDEAVEGRRELFRDRAGITRPDPAAVDLDHGDHLGRGAGQKALVGGVEVVPDERLRIARSMALPQRSSG